MQQQAAKAAAPVQPSAAPAAPSAADVARVAECQGHLARASCEAHLQKFQKYPRSAQRRNVEGTAWLRFRMDRDGKVLSYSIERTSEHEVLDEAALAMIERAQPLPPLPDDVPGDSIELDRPRQLQHRLTGDPPEGGLQMRMICIKNPGTAVERAVTAHEDER